MAQIKEEDRRILIALYHSVLQLLNTNEGRALLSGLLAEPNLSSSTISQDLLAHAQYVTECLNNEKDKIKSLATRTIKALMLFSDANQENGVIITTISSDSFSIDFEKLSPTLKAMSQEQWDELNFLMSSLLSNIPNFRISNVPSTVIGQVSPSHTWLQFYSAIGTMAKLATFNLSGNKLGHHTKSAHLGILIHALRQLPQLTRLNFSDNELASLNPAQMAHFLSLLSNNAQLIELDLSGNSFNIILQTQSASSLQFAFRGMYQLHTLNLSNTDFCFEQHISSTPANHVRNHWNSFCQLIKSLSQLRLLILNNCNLENLRQSEWDLFYKIIITNKSLIIEGLPETAPENIKIEINKRRLARIILDMEGLLTNSSSSDYVNKAQQIMNLLTPSLEANVLKLSTSEEKVRLQNTKDEFLWRLTREIRANIESNSEIILDPNYWLDISAASPNYSAARIELFELSYRQLRQNNAIIKEAFLAALPALFNEKGELITLGVWSNTFDHLLNQALGLPFQMQQLSAATRHTYLRYLFLENFLRHYPDWINNSASTTESTLTTTSADPEISTTTTSSLTASTIAASTLSQIVDSQQLGNEVQAKKFNQLWARLVTHLTDLKIYENNEMSEDSRIFQTLIVLREQRTIFKEQQELYRTGNSLALQAFINAMHLCLNENAKTIYFNINIDKFLLKAAGLQAEISSPLTTNSRNSILKYVIMLYLSQQEIFKDKAFTAQLAHLFATTTISKDEARVETTVTSSRAVLFPAEPALPELSLSDFEDASKQSLINNFWSETLSQLPGDSLAKEVQQLIAYMNQSEELSTAPRLKLA